MHMNNLHFKSMDDGVLKILNKDLNHTSDTSDLWLFNVMP